MIITATPINQTSLFLFIYYNQQLDNLDISSTTQQTSVRLLSQLTEWWLTWLQKIIKEVTIQLTYSKHLLIALTYMVYVKNAIYS